jgi:hypothetical protein
MRRSRESGNPYRAAKISILKGDAVFLGYSVPVLSMGPRLRGDDVLLSFSSFLNLFPS